MAACTQCGVQLPDVAKFCSLCGSPSVGPIAQHQFYPPLQHSSDPNLHPPAARGFAQIFGIHPAIAFLTFVVDSMLFGEEGLAAVIGLPTGGTSLAASLILSCTVGAVLGVIAYMAQKKWYRDDSESAFIKALILAFLTAIPTNIPAVVYGTAGIVGFFRKKE